MNNYSNSKIELMKSIRRKMETLRRDLVLLQSGNGGEIPDNVDNAALDVRATMSHLSNKLEKIIWENSKNNK